MTKTQVVLADDHQSMIAKVRETLGEEFEISGTAENSDRAIDLVQMRDADVLVIDISMPGLNGLLAAKRLQKASCRTKIVFLTIPEDPEFVSVAFAAGASAYVIKSRINTDLVPAIREAVSGNTFISKALNL